jgi:hypothetical protein
MQIPNSELKPNADGSYPDRKITVMYNYTALKFQFAIARTTKNGVTIYRDIDGETFSALDTDPTRYPADKILGMTLTASDLATLLAMAEADPEDAIALFAQLPTELKPELKAALKTLPGNVQAELKRAAIAHQAPKNHIPSIGKMVDIVPTKAITLYRPWAGAIAHLGKDIENRSWQCPLPVGDWIGIHAGAKWDEDAADWIQRTTYQDVSESDHPQGLVAIAEFLGNTNDSDSPWKIEGQVGWKLGRVIALDAPIQCRGQMKLWNIPECDRQNIHQQIQQSRVVAA